MRRRALLGAFGMLCLMTRRGAAQAGGVPSIAGAIPPNHPLHSTWDAWKAMCLTPEGRIIDGFQNGDSHSEGQSYGLVLAAAFDDMATFDSIMAWTENNLAIRDDSLLAWRWRHDQSPPVPDKNNASDGDLFYAWALSAVAVRYDRADLGVRARLIAADLVRLCVVAHPNGSGAQLFLPAAAGFITDTGPIINPSYYMPRAMREVAAATGTATLARVAEDGIAMMDQMAQTGLVPDWARITATGWQPPPDGFSANAGYEAMRVPLFAAWSGQAGHAAARRYASASIAAATDTVDATTVFDRTTGQSLEKSPHPGYQAIRGLLSCAGSDTAGAAIPAFSTDQPYYPATLHVMALVAQVEMYPQCVPL